MPSLPSWWPSLPRGTWQTWSSRVTISTGCSCEENCNKSSYSVHFSFYHMTLIGAQDPLC
jgi:hypothetical protein